MNYQGFFINLDRSTGRRAAVESQLAELGLGKRYRRFAAAEGNSLGFPNPKGFLPGEIGCFISHYLLLKDNLGLDAPLHVAEDDVLFARCTSSIVEWLIRDGHLKRFDIVFLDTLIPTANAIYKQYRDLYAHIARRDDSGRITETQFTVIDMKDQSLATTTSMVIAPQAIGKLHDLYDAELRNGPHLQIDLFLRRKMQEGFLRIGCVFPFVTSSRLEDVVGSTMDEHDLRLTALTLAIARQAFFVECDWDKCQEFISKHLAVSDDPQAQILTQLLGFSLEPKFKFR